MTTLYGGIDLHSNNNVIVLIDEQDKIVYRKRLRNELDMVLRELQPYHDELAGVVVESTYNWYWLVDGLMEADYQVHLANTTAIQQYNGLKYTDDNSDAWWLAHMLRLGILPKGHICPKEFRAVRDLLRKRSHLVRQKTMNVLSIQNLVARNSGLNMNANAIRKLSADDIDTMYPMEERALAIKASHAVVQCLNEQIKLLEQAVLKRVKLSEAYQLLLTVPGIGQALGLTIMLETGNIERFHKPGDYASYARCVRSEKISNNKKKGENNARNGNKYLAWAFVEAANFAIRYNEEIRRFYQRKAAKTKPIVARKAVAHKLARACFFILRDQVPFDVKKAFE